MNNERGKWWDILGKYLTFVVIAIYLVSVLNGIFGFIPLGTIWINIVNAGVAFTVIYYHMPWVYVNVLNGK